MYIFSDIWLTYVTITCVFPNLLGHQPPLSYTYTYALHTRATHIHIWLIYDYISNMFVWYRDIQCILVYYGINLKKIAI